MKSNIANIVTLFSAISGLISISFAIDHNFQVASFFIFLAVILDGADGMIARKWGGTEQGKLLDSMADMVAFCIAPATLLYTAYYDPSRGTAFVSLENALVLGVAGIFGIMGMLRLYRFTATAMEDMFDSVFIGLPTPAGAVCVIYLYWGVGTEWIVIGLSYIVALLMISDLTYRKMRDSRGAGAGIVMALSVIFIVIWPEMVGVYGILILPYIGSGPIGRVKEYIRSTRKKVRKKHLPE